jgi:phage terminase large subunit-like protein
MKSEPPAWAVRTEADKRAITEGCYWDAHQADKIVTFTNRFFKSQFATNFKLTEAQAQALQQLHGWRLPNGNRRFRTANLHVPKKSFGKTMLVAALVFFELYASGEPSSFVCSAAASIANAAQVFDEVRYSIERSPFAAFSKIKRHVKEIEVADLNARYRSVASDGKRLHGFNCSLCIMDEGHVIPAELWHSLRYSTAARPNGLVVVISTAGDNQSHWYHGIYTKSKRVIGGEDLDITHFCLVYEADGDPEDPAQWRKANPLLGSPWCPADTFARDLEAAKSAGLGEWLNFLRLRLNKWVAADELVYFNVSSFDSYKQQPSEDQLAKAPAAIGVDISEVGDPSSISISFDLGDNRSFVRSWAWVCERQHYEREKGLLRSFRDFPEITITKGDMLDERAILKHLVDLCKRYRVSVVNFDPRSAYVLANRLSEEGVKCERVPPSPRYFNPAMVEFRKALEEGRIKHDGSSWLKFCLANVRVQVNKYDEVYPVRKKSVDKIDGAISTLLAYLGLLSNKGNAVQDGIVLV